MDTPLKRPPKRKQRSLLRPMASARSQKPDTDITHRMSKPLVLFFEIGEKIAHLSPPRKAPRLARSFLRLPGAEFGRASHGYAMHAITE